MHWPPADLIAESRPLARHGSGGLLLARVLRFVELLVQTPTLMWDVARGYSARADFLELPMPVVAQRLPSSTHH